jgi:hypothetical protein
MFDDGPYTRSGASLTWLAGSHGNLTAALIHHLKLGLWWLRSQTRRLRAKTLTARSGCETHALAVSTHIQDEVGNGSFQVEKLPSPT